MRIALIGDYDAGVVAHRAIPRALALEADAGGRPCEWAWLHTSVLAGDPSSQLAGFDGVWCVPASPYASPRGAIAAIAFARQAGRPFLGTCGGFQHALLEYAESVWGLGHAAHAESEPDAADPVIAPLACSLVEKHGEVRLVPGSRLAAIYGTPAATEEYHCSYGLSPAFSARLANGPLRVAALDAGGEVRAVELDGHPFFVATLFQPERRALLGRPHPVVSAFVCAAAREVPRR